MVLGRVLEMAKMYVRKHSGNAQETLTKRPENTRKRSGNTHAKDLKHPGNAQETLMQKTKNTQETLRKHSCK